MRPGQHESTGYQHDLHDPKLLADPYPFYRHLQAKDPVHWNEPARLWLVTRYADVVAALRDRRLSANWVGAFKDKLPRVAQLAVGPLFTTVASVVLFTDPPDHTRLRGLMNKAFTPRTVVHMHAEIQTIVDELLDRVQPAGRMDIVDDLAAHVPIVVIARMLGVPPTDGPLFRKCVDSIAAAFGGGSPRPDYVLYAQLRLGELKRYFRGLIADRRTGPKDDLLQGLIAAQQEGERLSEEELYANLANLLFAGYETTLNLIGNGTLALLSHPQQLQQLSADPSLIDAAVEEMLRYESPAQMLRRVATEDIEIGGRRILQGQTVMLGIGAANRDPAEFPQPDRFDITRRENKHLAFGTSSHYCLGAPLARLEAQIAISTLLRRMPALRLAGSRPKHREILALRGLQSLPVEF